MLTFQVFEGLNKSEINYIVDAGMICPLDGGKTLFRKGDLGHEMYVILTGKIEIIDELGKKKNVIAELGPGEIFGEMAMFEKGHTRSTHAVIGEPSQVLVLSEDILNELIRDKKFPRQFLVNVIAVLCRRLRLTNSMYMRAKYGNKERNAEDPSQIP